MTSVNHFTYYVCLVDDASRFIWFVPLKKKSEFSLIFRLFVKWVDRQFSRRIKILQSDGGGEFTTTQLTTFLQEEELSTKFLVHTRRNKMVRQNGVIEQLENLV